MLHKHPESHIRTGRKEPDQRIKVGDWREAASFGAETSSAINWEGRAVVHIQEVNEKLRLKRNEMIKNSISSAQKLLWS